MPHTAAIPRPPAPRRRPADGCAFAVGLAGLILGAAWLGLWLAIIAMARP